MNVDGAERVEVDGPDAATATSGASVLSGGAWSSLSRILPQIYVLLQSAVAARFLGVEGMGRQSFISFVQLSLTLLLGLGLNGALVRYVAETLGQRRPEATRGLVTWVWRVECAAAAAALVLFGFVSSVDTDLRAAWLLAGVACALGVLNHVPYAVLSGAQRWRQFSTISLTTGTAGTLLTVAVLVAGGGITGIFAVQALISAVSLLWTMSLTRRTLADVAPRAGPFDDLRAPLLKFAAVNWIGFVLSIIVWRRSEFFFLKRYSTDTQIGLYSVAFAAVAALVNAMDAISVVIAPAVATLSGAGAVERIRTGFSRAVRLVVYLTLPLTAGALAVGPAALRVVYGSDYRGSAAPLLIMLVVFPLLPLMNLSSAMLWGLGRVRVWLGVCTAASFVNLSLNFMLIPRYGAIGGAIANSGAQVSAAVAIVTYACRSTGPVTWHLRALARSAFAALACGLAAFAVVSLVDGLAGLVLAVAVGLLSYCAVAAGWRIIPEEDASWVADGFGRMLGGRVGRVARRVGQTAPAAAVPASAEAP